MYVLLLLSKRIGWYRHTWSFYYSCQFIGGIMIRTPIRAQKPANIPMLALVRSFPVSICLTLPKGSTYSDSLWLDISGVRRSSLGVTGTLPDECILGVWGPDVRSLGVELAGVELCIPDPPVTIGVSILTFWPSIKNFIRWGELEIIWANLLVVHSVSSRKRFLTLGKNNLRERRWLGLAHFLLLMSGGLGLAWIAALCIAYSLVLVIRNPAARDLEAYLR